MLIGGGKVPRIAGHRWYILDVNFELAVVLYFCPRRDKGGVFRKGPLHGPRLHRAGRPGHMLDVPTWVVLGWGRELTAAAALVALVAPSGVETLVIGSERVQDRHCGHKSAISGVLCPQVGRKDQARV